MKIKLKNRQYYSIIFWLSLIATVMSLYYSHYGDISINFLDGIFFDTSRAIKPCDMCWYIRIAQYPLLIISWLALYYEDYLASKKHIVGLSTIWLLVSFYKVLLEYWFIKLWADSFCNISSAVPCNQATYLFNTNISLAVSGCIVFLIILTCCFRLRKH